MLKTYDIKNYLITYNGQDLSGWAEDETFSVEWESDWWTDKNSADGVQTVRSAQNDYRANVTLNFMQTSDSIGILDAYLLADTLGPAPRTNDTTFELAIKSLLPGGMNLIAVNAYIKKPSDIKGAKEASERSYSFRCPALVPVGGGM